MKRTTVLIILAAFVFAGSALAGTDNNPLSAGMTQSRGAGGFSFDAAFGNPALLGLDMPPRHSLSFFPTSVALWSDKFAPPFNSYLLMDFTNIGRAIALYVSAVAEESFPDIRGKSSEEVSAELTKQFRGGVGIYTGMRTSPIVFATRGFAVNVRSYADVEVRIPEGLLLPLFSYTDGMTAGNTLDFSDLKVDAVVASEIGVKLGFSAVIPFMRDYLGLDKGSAGAGVKLVLGHALVQAEAADGSKAVLNPETNRYDFDATVKVTAVGTGLHGNWRTHNLLDSGIINGQGWGIDLGAVFHNKRHFIGVDVQNLGMIFWGSNVYETTLRFKKDGLDLMEFASSGGSVSETFSGSDEYWPGKNTEGWERSDTLVSAGNLITVLPATFNLGYTYLYDFSDREDVRYITKYVSGSVGYEQQFMLGPGRSTYMPRFTLGAASGMLSGYLPLRYGIILGGSESIGSAFGFGLDFQYVSFDASYKSVGSPVLLSEKGFELAAALTYKWGYKEKKRKITDPPAREPEPDIEPEYRPEEPALPEVDELGGYETYMQVVETMPPEPEPEPEPEPFLPEVLPTVEEVQQLNTAQGNINFLSGKAELTSVSYPALDQIAELLKNYPKVRYEIQGHTDSDGSDELNLVLSASRAATVRNYLLSRGTPEGSLIAIGYGEHNPIASNATPQGKAQNRRVQFVLIETQEQYDALKQKEAEMESRIKPGALRRRR